MLESKKFLAEKPSKNFFSVSDEMNPRNILLELRQKVISKVRTAEEEPTVRNASSPYLVVPLKVLKRRK